MKAKKFILAILTCLFAACVANAADAAKRAFSAKDYGAVGDDKTDNTEAFSARLDALVKSGGGRMLIPDGIYRGRIIIPSTKEWITIEQLDMEIAGAKQTDENNAWQATDFNLYDPKNLGTGEVKYWVVEGNVGAVEKFTREGGASILARRIGASRNVVGEPTTKSDAK